MTDSRETVEGPPGALRVVRDAFSEAANWCRARDRRLLIALAALIAAQISYAAFRASRVGPSDLVWGFLGPTREILWEGKNPSIAHIGNAYSPFFYAAMVPFALLPNVVASIVWSLVNFAALAGIVALVRAVLRRSWEPQRLVSPVWSLLLAGTLVVDNLDLGQSNLVTLFLVCCSVYSLVQEEDAAAGLWLSAAVAWKVTPGIFLLYLVLKRRWKALLTSAAGMIVCLVGVPAIAFGPRQAILFAKGWIGLIVEPVMRGGLPRSINVEWTATNQSLDAFVHRAFTPFGRDTFGGLHAWLDPAFLTDAGADRLALVLKFVVLGVLVVVCLRGGTDPRRAPPFEVSALLLAALFLSPVSWYSHYMALLVPYAVALQAIRGGLVCRLSRFLAWSVGLSAATVAASLSVALRSYSLVFLGQLPFFFALVTSGASMGKD
jgi:alpha-1,2-mannosyltransferase